jgi:AraC-like DNA-binding protein
MVHRYLKVNPLLADYVRSVLVLNDPSDTQGSDLPLFTSGMPALLCRTENDKNQVTLFGQTVPDESWMIENTTQVIAFFFKPFSIGPLFKLPAEKLKEKPFELSLWHAQKAMALNLQLAPARSTEEKMEILNHFILIQLRANQRECHIIRQATDQLMLGPGPEALTQLLSELHITERSFQRIFKKYAGITPNEYRRICQFYAAFLHLKEGSFNKLTDVAYHSGYFDQSHFIRSFKEFTEITPNDYLKSGLGQKSE